MNALIRVTLALAAVVVCPLVLGQPVQLPPQAAQAHASAGLARMQTLVEMMKHPRGAQTAGVNAVEANTLSGPRIANPYRAYPPSCLADPLPDTKSGPFTQFQMPLYTRDTNGTAMTPETVTITIWRMACSSSGNLTPYNTDHHENAALLMRIDRDSSVDGHTDVFPTFPSLTANQANATGNFVRAASEPNTVIDDGPYDAPVYISTTYVLENYPNSLAGFTYFNYDFTFFIDPVIDASCTGCQSVNINGYQPTQGDYPAAFAALPIDGYMSSSYYDPAHNGEGFLLEVYDNPGGTTRTVFAAWYTYDPLGIPFWLTAQGTVAVGANAMTGAPVYYFNNGGFAGDFGSIATLHVWGTMSMSWTNCNELVFSYNGATDPTIVNGPTGSGTRTWVRISDINGLSCE
jgi:hypothetical protein